VVAVGVKGVAAADSGGAMLKGRGWRDIGGEGHLKCLHCCCRGLLALRHDEQTRVDDQCGPTLLWEICLEQDAYVGGGCEGAMMHIDARYSCTEEPLHVEMRCNKVV
jgi:hypothetical protein